MMASSLKLLLLLVLWMPPAQPLLPLSHLLDVFDPFRFSGVEQRMDALDGRCREDMQTYVRGLMSAEPWATKMYDATGRYSQGLYWGNGFWIGSNSLCREIDLNSTASAQDSPYRVAFHIMKFRLNFTDTSYVFKIPNEIFIGLCLPRACREADATRLLSLSVRLQEEAIPDLPREVHIIKDKFLSREYSYWNDPRAYVMAASIGLLTVLTVVGTIYELWLRRKQRRTLHDEDSVAEDLPTDDQKPAEGNTECNGNHIAYSKSPVFVAKDVQKPPAASDGEDAVSLTKRGVEEGMEIRRLPSGVEKDLTPTPKQSILGRLLLCFSALSNARSICSFNVGADTIAPIHGLRFLSLLWVILGHTCLVAFQFSDNKNFRAKAEEDFLYQTLSSGTYAVDTFFFISGLLVSFLYFRTVTRCDVRQLTFTSGGFRAQGMQFLGMLIYRFIRLTPPYMFTLGLVELTMKYCHDHGSLEPVQTDHINCPKYWWRNVLYINTLFPLEERCMVWSWYLASDTQFYVIGTILLIIAVNHFWLSAGMVIVFMLSTWTTTAFITIYTEHTPTIQDPFANYDELYDKPWTRIGPYLVGMCLGWILFKTKCKMYIKKWVLALGWILSAVSLALVSYSLYFFDFGPAASAVYTSLSHTAWAMALAWIVLVCTTGNARYVNSILSWKYIYPLSRITYCSYLLHPVLMRSIACNSDSPTHIGRDIIAIVFLGYTVASYGFSFLISLVFEAPVVALLRLGHPMKRRKATT